MIDPWRTRNFGLGYSAEWLPIGQHTWRIIREAGSVKMFPSAREALRAAKSRFMRSLEPEIRATLPVDAEGMGEKMKAEAEAWLKSSRKDIKQQQTIHRGRGKKAFTVQKGRVMG